MTDRILIINPNSTEAVTQAIDRAVASLRSSPGPEIACMTMKEGPPGIETDQHRIDVVEPLCRIVAREEARTAAFINACFSDPGLREMRERTAKPVFGIAESGLLTALAIGRQVGVISILENSVARHLRYFDALGIAGRIAGDMAVGLGVREVADGDRAYKRMTEVGRELRDKKGADVLVLGCAGMSHHRRRLEDELGVPVVDPTQVTVGMAVTAVRLGYRRAQPAAAA
ncbi:MAG: Asp/Glu racemase [Rhodospirillales bacterium]|nr:Asp/Glu racemase [Rhodospirillales bacterium]